MANAVFSLPPGDPVNASVNGNTNAISNIDADGNGNAYDHGNDDNADFTSLNECLAFGDLPLRGNRPGKSTNTFCS